MTAKAHRTKVPWEGSDCAPPCAALLKSWRGLTGPITRSEFRAYGCALISAPDCRLLETDQTNLGVRYACMMRAVGSKRHSPVRAKGLLVYNTCTRSDTYGEWPPLVAIGSPRCQVLNHLHLIPVTPTEVACATCWSDAVTYVVADS